MAAGAVEGCDFENGQEQFQLGEIDIAALVGGDAKAQFGQRDGGQRDLALLSTVQPSQNRLKARALVQQVDADIGVEQHHLQRKFRG